MHFQEKVTVMNKLFYRDTNVESLRKNKLDILSKLSISINIFHSTENMKK